MNDSFKNVELENVLEYLYADTILPELHAALGTDCTYKLLAIFGGMKITVPSYNRIKEFKRNVDIYEALCYSNCKDTIRMLADKYDVTEVWVRSIFKRMRREYPRMMDFMMHQRDSVVNVTTRRKPDYEQSQSISSKNI